MKVLLAIYPNTIGYGFGCLQMPNKLIDAGVIKTRPLSNDRLLEHIEKAIGFYQPTILIVRDGESIHKKGERNKRLIEEVLKLAIVKNLPVYQYSRQQVRDVFELMGATTKHEISQRIIEVLPELSERAPQKRKLWASEDYSTGLFDALALAYAHDYLTE